MSEPLDESYFVWLYGQVANPKVRDPEQTYWKLLRQLFSKEFVWIIPNDDNRLVDGKDLRREFMDDRGIRTVPRDWLEMGCSFLELMVGMSRRLEFEAGATPHYWFWELIGNLKLERFNDKRGLNRSAIDEILDRVIFRNYDEDGHGGFFPLRHSRDDQKQVELWYQMSAYVLEQG